MSTSIEVFLSDFDTDDIIEEFMDRLDNARFNKRIINKFVSMLEERGYIVVYPKLMVQKIMLEEFIEANNLTNQK